MGETEKVITEEILQEAKIRFLNYNPYDKQLDLHDSGVHCRERILSAGNQCGKTYCLAHETAFHLTGVYPSWWQGKKFSKPVYGWMAGVTNESTRDILQYKLFGDFKNDFEGGILHASYIKSYTVARGVSNLLDTVIVKHKLGESRIQLKSYEKGREKWQGASLDFIWFDEEPPMDIYMEGLSRTNATGGITYLSFTPLKGMTDVVLRFFKEEHKDRKLVLMGLNDVDHFPPEQKEKMIESYPKHERKARLEGIPTMGSGRIYPFVREDIECQTPELRDYWVRIAGMDLGWDHPTAIVWIAWDRDRDIIYLYDCYKKRETTIGEHSLVIRQKGEWIPMAWPHDALKHDSKSGEQLAQQYRDLGVNMLPHRACFEDNTNGVEAGIHDIVERMKTGRFKVDENLSEWWEEFELYHRDDGKIVKERDDLMDATRYAIMMLRYAQKEPKEFEEYDHDIYNDFTRSEVTGY